MVSKVYGRLWEKAYKGMTDEELDMVNQAREKLVEIIRPLREELKKKKATVESILRRYISLYRLIICKDRLTIIELNFRIRVRLAKPKSMSRFM